MLVTYSDKCEIIYHKKANVNKVVFCLPFTITVLITMKKMI
jgi:hypothetical protein